MAVNLTIQIRIVEEEFIEDDGIYKWTWIYLGNKLRFSAYHKL